MVYSTTHNDKNEKCDRDTYISMRMPLTTKLTNADRNTKVIYTDGGS